MSKSINAGVLIVTLLIGIAIGYWLTPEYGMQNTAMKENHELGQADQWVDLRYLDGMIAHHLSAIYMLEQAETYSTRPEVKELAAAVIAADRAGIEQLYRYKKEWYGNSRQITNFRQQNLGQHDEKFDLRLLNALLIHHQEAIATAQEISTKSTRTEVLNIADEVTQTLSANATQLRQWRKEWYGLN